MKPMKKVELKTVQELTKLPFHVPFYQRGYRWKDQQVRQLIEDIKEFQPTEKHPFYFLQALVVSANREEGFHVVDGQQRLTTLQLILEGSGKEFKITYAREANSAIDQFYKGQALKDIDRLLSDNEREDFQQKILTKCKFLFYEVRPEEELDTFSKLNSGKIPAKDSELVKCVLLSPGADEASAITQARGNEWDVMERSLRNDDFFAFMTPRNTWREDDRMTVLLRYAGFNPEVSDEIFPFLMEVQKAVDETSRETVWKKICSVYYRLTSWFKDPLLYHVFGWYVHRRGSQEPRDLNEFYNLQFPDQYQATDDDYQRGHNNDLYWWLLLDQVAYCWKRWPMRYDFKSHRAVSAWSIEHIFARNQRDLKLKREELEAWIPNLGEERWKEYQNACTPEGMGGYQWLENQPELKGLYPGQEVDNSLRNLALLPKSANSALSNKLFKQKREDLVYWDESRGYWIPPATQALFFKTLPGLSMSDPFWSGKDKDSYIKDMTEIIAEFQNAWKEHFCKGEK